MNAIDIGDTHLNISQMNSILVSVHMYITVAFQQVNRKTEVIYGNYEMI